MKKRLLIIATILIVLFTSTAMASEYYRVNTSWLKSRETPSFNGRVEDSYRRDFALKILSTDIYGWAYVRFYPVGKTGFVRLEYLKAAKSYTAYLNTDSVWVRKGPAKTFKPVGMLDRGAEVTVLSHGVAFDYVTYDGQRGYISNRYLSTEVPSTWTVRVKNPTGRTVNLRVGPGKEYMILGEYAPGTKATMLRWGVTWSKVRINGKTGYMMTRYLD